MAADSAPAMLPAIGYLVLVPTLGAYGLYLTGLQAVEASHASILSTVEPVVAALLGVLILHESLSLLQIAGIALVLAAAVILNRSRT